MRIVSRYLTSEIIASSTVTVLVLWMIFFSNQLIRFLNSSIFGALAAEDVWTVMILQLPKLLTMLLPASLFLGILLAYSRLHVHNEPLVMSALGLSPRYFLGVNLWLAAALMIMVTVLSLWVNPLAQRYIDILTTKASREPLQLLEGEQFHRFPKYGLVVRISDKAGGDKDAQKNAAGFRGDGVFAAETAGGHGLVASCTIVARSAEKEVAPAQSIGGHYGVSDKAAWRDKSLKRLAATKGSEDGKEEYGASKLPATRTKMGDYDEYLSLMDGARYCGTPGQKDYEVTYFKRYSIRMPRPDPVPAGDDSTKDMSVLWRNYRQSVHAAAEFQWRCAQPISALLLVVAATALGVRAPIRGRYASLFPAVALYTLYVNLLMLSRAWLKKGVISAQFGLWWVHAAMLICTLLLCWRAGFLRVRRSVRREVSAGANPDNDAKIDAKLGVKTNDWQSAPKSLTDTTSQHDE